MRALAAPASLKGVLPARDAARALANGLRTWVEADVMPIADGGEGTLDAMHAARGGEWRVARVHDAFGRNREARWLMLPDDTAIVEAAEAIPLDPDRLDPFGASSRGLGELIQAVGKTRELLVCLGGTANVDGGAGLLEVVHELPAPTRVACDVAVPLIDAARVFARQKGAGESDVGELERRLRAMAVLEPVADLPGAGAAGGLGGALAALGGRLVPGAELVLDQVGFDANAYDLVVTGEGTVDATTFLGKAPGEVARRSAAAGVRCVVFGGVVAARREGVEIVELSGSKARALEDLEALGRRLRTS